MAAVMASAATAQTQSAGLDPEAQRILKASTDFLARQKQFSLDTRNPITVVRQARYAAPSAR